MNKNGRPSLNEIMTQLIYIYIYICVCICICIYIRALVAHFVTYLSRTSCSVWVCTKEGYDKCLAYGLDPRKASRNLNDPRPLAEPCRAATNQTTDDVPRSHNWTPFWWNSKHRLNWTSSLMTWLLSWHSPSICPTMHVSHFLSR